MPLGLQHRALLLSEIDLTDWRASHQSGQGPGALPYGADALETHGYEVLGVRLPRGRLPEKLVDVVEHRLGNPAVRAVLGAAKFASADVVFTALEQGAIAPAWLRRIPLSPYRRTPLVALTCWLAEMLQKADDDERLRLRRRFENVDVFVYWSTNQTRIFLDAGFRPETLLPVNFGVDAEYFAPGIGARTISFLAVGRDFGRDYTTLFNAIRGTDLVVDVVCPIEYLPPNIPSNNVRLHGQVSAKDYANLLLRAQTVIVPTHELAYPTGQSVALEASASGCCVVTTATQPMKEYFTDGKNALLSTPHDASSLSAAMRAAVTDETLRRRLGMAARELVEQSYTSQMMWSQIVRGLHEMQVLRTV